MRSNFELGCSANRVLAQFAQCGEPPFDAQQDVARARSDSGTLVLNIRPASIAHSGDFHECGLARFTEVSEMCLNALHERI
jgi:hypothetical protein